MTNNCTDDDTGVITVGTVIDTVGHCGHAVHGVAISKEHVVRAHIYVRK